MPTFNFKFSGINKTRKVQESVKEIPSKFGYHLNDLSRICVYEHYYDNEEFPFYVGQGTINRAFVFNRNMRNNSWNNKVKDISKVHVKIIKIDISEKESIIIEKELIAKYGRLDNNTGCLTNENDGGKNSQTGSNNYFFGKQLSGNNNGNYGNKYESNNLSIPVLQIDIFGNIIKEWASATQAAEIGGFNTSPIRGCCIGKRHIHKNYQWIYKKDYDSNKNYEYVPGKTNSGIYLAFPINAIGDISKLLIIYSSSQAISLGFNMKNISQVANGNKKSHGGYVFRNFFNLPKEEKELYKEYIEIDN